MTRKKKKKEPEIVEETIKESVIEEKEEITVLKEVPTEEPVNEANYAKEVFDVIATLPEAKMIATQRWYGEEFLPEYVKARAKLRTLAGLK